MDYFKTFGNVIKAFKKFIMRLPQDGHLVCNRDDVGNANLKLQTSKSKFKIQNYNFRQPEAKKLAKILKVPGKHNVSNALAALNVARILGVKDSIAFKALGQFNGTWRRFETKEIGPKPLDARRYTLISDYGHHPNEVAATLKAAREKFGKRTIWLIFQPHQHQRTYYLFKDFVKLFKTAKIDHMIITDIYDVAGRETKTINKQVDSQLLVKKIARKNVQYMPLEAAEKYVKDTIKGGEVLIIMGAGDIYTLFDRF